MCTAGVGGVADPHRIGNAADCGGVEIEVGDLQLREHQLGGGRSVACRNKPRARHQGARGLQQRNKPLVGFPANRLGQMKIESRVRSVALIRVRSIACYCNDVRPMA